MFGSIFSNTFFDWEAPLECLEMAMLLHEAGLMHGIFNTLTGGVVQLGPSVAGSLEVDLLAYIGPNPNPNPNPNLLLKWIYFPM